MQRQEEHQALSIYFYAILMSIKGIVESLWLTLFPQKITRPPSETRARPAHPRKFSAASTLSSTPTLVEPSEEHCTLDTVSLASSDTLVDEPESLSRTSSIDKKHSLCPESCKKHLAKFRKSRSTSPPTSPTRPSSQAPLLSPRRSNTMPMKKFANSPCKVLRRLGSHPPPPTRSQTLDTFTIPEASQRSQETSVEREQFGLRSVSVSGKPTSRRRRKA